MIVVAKSDARMKCLVFDRSDLGDGRMSLRLDPTL